MTSRTLGGTASGRWAMVLSFAAYRQSLDTSLVVGTAVHAYAAENKGWLPPHKGDTGVVGPGGGGDERRIHPVSSSRFLHERWPCFGAVVVASRFTALGVGIEEVEEVHALSPDRQARLEVPHQEGRRDRQDEVDESHQDRVDRPAVEARDGAHHDERIARRERPPVAEQCGANLDSCGLAQYRILGSSSV